MNPSFFGIIPARGGSKGVKNKNIRLVNNKPLICYTIEAARKSSKLNSFIVSTDSVEIKDVACSAGAKVPFIRPSEYATDQASTVEVVSHTLKWVDDNDGRAVDYIVLLQPTTPLRSSKDIDAAIELILQNPNADSLISCYDATHVHPSIMYKYDGKCLNTFLKGSEIIRRQEFDPVYVRNGCIYIIKRDYFVKEHCLVSDSPLGYIMPRLKSLNIDEELDLLVAELILKYGTSILEDLYE